MTSPVTHASPTFWIGIGMTALTVVAAALWLAFDAISRNPAIPAQVEQPPAARTGTANDSAACYAALVIDDFGPEGTDSLTAEFFGLPGRVTISIIPGNVNSAKICSDVIRAGGEMMIHLPMEPIHHVSMGEKYMLMAGSSPTEIHNLLDQVTAELPGAVGINNHMGSKATCDPTLMKRLAVELKKRGLLFYDSWTGKRTVAYKTMRKEGVPSLRRDVFLDDTADPDTVRSELAGLVRIARQRGWAVATGHARPVTLHVLREEMARYSGEGVAFITYSDLQQRLRMTMPANNR